jgi:hypothetical protein
MANRNAACIESKKEQKLDFIKIFTHERLDYQKIIFSTYP